MEPASRLHGPPRWTMIVRPDATALYDKLRQQFADAPWVALFMDRRRAEPRQAATPPAGEQPAPERRFTARRSGSAGARALGSHRLAHEPPGLAVYELVDLTAATDCLTCRSQVWFEMPRFGEPPTRLQIHVEHDKDLAGGPRHLVTLDAYAATGRQLVSCQVAGRLGNLAP
jgi:hypothetical protein